MEVYGFIQGVGFRYSTRRKAIELGVLGSVRNLVDGRVEIIAEAEQSVLKEFEAWCRVGPDGAFVDSLKIVDFPSQHHYGFEIVM